MIKLADIFQSGMTLQRQKPIKFWGESDTEEHIEIKINGILIDSKDIPRGTFEFFITPQEAAENIKLEIGCLILDKVDIGEVWIAGGQSNMEFCLKYDIEGDSIIADASDDHFRFYDVAKYSFPGEREDGFKDDSMWDRWLTFCPDNASTFSAVGTYFAMELRKELGVPVAVIGCNWGGTSASAWLDREYLMADDELKTYIEDYNAKIAKLDLEQYYAINKIVRQRKELPESKQFMDYMMKHNINSMEMIKELTKVAGDTPSVNEENNLYMENYALVGPNHENRPFGLYEMMVRQISGFTVRGVIWYQGEADVEKAGIYAKLFSKVIECWRRDFNDNLPFLFVQLAPFGHWMDAAGDSFPIIRQQQGIVENTINDTYMISISDVGDEQDIHPKNKRPIGHRLALCARNKIYGEDILSGTPEAATFKIDGDKIIISFMNAEGLYIEGGSLNALKIISDDIELETIHHKIDGEQLILSSEKFEKALSIQLEFACTAYYKVNLYNKAGIPAKPFLFNWKS